MQRKRWPRFASSVSVAMLLLALPSCSGGPRRVVNDAVRGGTPSIPDAAERRQCAARLTEANAKFSPLPDRFYGAGCSTVNAVRLLSVNSDTAMLGIANLGPVTCPTADAFAGWARYGVDRAARQILGSPLVRIETMGSYSCRNVAGSARRSAHATAQAIDVSAFVLADGQRVSVLGDWSAGSEAQRRFLRVVRESACRRFGTVLSPDYNAAHANHLHLEAGSGWRFCR